MRKMAEKAVDENRQKLEALFEISKALTSDTYLDDILKLIVVVTAKVMDSNICSLMLLNSDTQELEIRATQSVSDLYLKKPRIKLGEGVSGIVAKENRVIVCRDVKKDPLYLNKEVAKKENLCSLLSMPLSLKGKVLGVINCYTSEEHEFTQEEKDVLSMVANQAALTIENTDLAVRMKLIEEELETRKIIERAKDILMDERGVSGHEAFQAIRRKSMDARKPIRDVAEAIILASEVGGN
ncbi:MAG: GAF and ANTAR domain-containing protein [Actinobacteria bacterium]|nr:GAF and ANTAR domain-containing protein [Actinomycetota bacterium]